MANNNVRDGINLVVGGRISFSRFEALLRPQAVELISKIAGKVRGHNTIIKVRGHATLEALPPESAYKDSLELAFARARAVRDALVKDGIRPKRIRVESAGPYEPLVAHAYDEERRSYNRRVEIIVTEAIVDDYAGVPLLNEEKDPGHG